MPVKNRLVFDGVDNAAKEIGIGDDSAKRLPEAVEWSRQMCGKLPLSISD